MLSLASAVWPNPCTHPSWVVSVFSWEGKQSELENSTKMMTGNACSEIDQFFRGPMFETISINTLPFLLQGCLALEGRKKPCEHLILDNTPRAYDETW